MIFLKKGKRLKSSHITSIKHYLLIFLLLVFKYHLKVIYVFIKLFSKARSQVFFLSRQSDDLPLNYRLLIEGLTKQNIEVRVICKKVTDGINALVRNEKKQKRILIEIRNGINYYLSIYKQMWYSATSKVIIVDGYNVAVSLLKHRRGTKIIQLWHALGAIKKFGYQTIGYPDGLDPQIAKILCMHANYDLVISGSKAMNKYFAEAFNVDPEKVVAIGTPMVDYLLNKDESITQKIYQKYPIMKKKINVLYSPTFRDDGRDNTLEVINSFDYRKINLIITSHPKNQEISPQKNVIIIKRNEFSTFDILKTVDYVITDYSALAMDACVLNKKLLFYVYDWEEYCKDNGLNIDLFKELPGLVSKEIKDLIEIIIINSYNEEAYQRFRKKFISNLEGNSTNLILEIIKEYLDIKN